MYLRQKKWHEYGMIVYDSLVTILLEFDVIRFFCSVVFVIIDVLNSTQVIRSKCLLVLHSIFILMFFLFDSLHFAV